MTLEWIRFFAVAVLLLGAVLSFLSAVAGVFRFGFVMNRIHAAGIGDTLGLFCTALALGIAAGPSMHLLKLVLLVPFLWFTSPVSTHFVGQAEYFTNPELKKHLRVLPPEEETNEEEGRTDAG